MSGSMREEPVTIASNGRQLVGMVHHPEETPRAGVVLCHGFTGNKLENKRLFVEAAREFARSGLWALRFDFFGSGDSEGEFHESRVSINIQNLRDVLAWTDKLGLAKLFVLGISMGAATAILTLSEGGVPEIAGLVLWSTVPDMRELFEAKAGMPIEKFPQVEQYEYDGWLIDREFYLDAIRYDVQGSFSKLALPKLVVQGDQDDPVFVRGFEAFQRIAQPPAKFEMIPGAGHTYQTVKHRRQVIEISKNWLLEQMA